MNNIVANCVQKDNGTLDPGNIHLSPGWQNRKLPLHITHDLAIYQARTRDGYPMCYIPATEDGAKLLYMALADDSHRDRQDDRKLWWFTPRTRCPEQDAAEIARGAFDQMNRGWWGDLRVSCPMGINPMGINMEIEVQNYRTDDCTAETIEEYESETAPYAATDIAEWEAGIEEDRREEEEEFQRKNREREAVAREEAKSIIPYTSAGWQSRRNVPLFVSSTREQAVAMAARGFAVVHVPMTRGGMRVLADLLFAEPARTRSKDKWIVFLLPHVDDVGMECFYSDWDPDGTKDAYYQAQQDARTAVHDMCREFNYWTDARIREEYTITEGEAPNTADAIACLNYWEKRLRDTPREKWLHEEHEILSSTDDTDGLTDEEIEALDERREQLLRALGPMPAEVSEDTGDEDSVREEGVAASPAPATGTGDSPAGGATRTRIQVSDLQYCKMEDATHAAVVAANSPPFVFVGPSGLSELYRPEPGATSRIRPLDSAALRRVFSRAADWERKSEKKTVAAFPPPQLLDSYLTRTEWPGIPPIVGVSAVPILRSDGSVCQVPGYDPPTKLFYEPNCDFAPIPENPTREQARAAAEFLLSGFSQFPFAGVADKAALLSLVLTPIARPAFDGPAPFFALSANAPGAGKGALIDSVSIIATGEDAPGKPYPVAGHGRMQVEHDDNIGKLAKSVALAGHVIFHLDNCPRAHEFGGPALESITTSTRNSDRILGTSSAPSVAMRMTWVVSGNLIRPRGDMVRRTISIGLLDHSERPDERVYTGPDVKTWAKANRGELVSAALTILSAYIRAGRPNVGLRSMGSFEGWSDLVRNAVVWLGYDDPRAARAQLAVDDPEAQEREAVIALLVEAGGDDKPVTARQVVGRVATELEAIRKAMEALRKADVVESTGPAKPLALTDLDALFAAAITIPPVPLVTCYRRVFPMHPLPNAHSLGLRIHQHRTRTATGGRRIEQAGEKDGSKLWRVVQKDTDSLPPPPAPPPERPEAR